MARVVLFGKLPPIQGGVSAQTLETVGALQHAGHQCTVVTNHRSVAPDYRCRFDEEDERILAERLAGARLIALDPDPVPFHIPFSPAFETRMLGVAIDVCAEADLILGSYYQPYGVVAAMAARLTGKACAIQHAGSDVARLALHPDLGAAYRALFRDCALISTSPRSRAALEAVFLSDQGFRIVDMLPGVAMPSYYNQPRQSTQSDTDRPFTIGIYGKCGEQKGHFDLLEAVAAARPTRRPVRLHAILGGAFPIINAFREDAERLGVDYFIEPFVAPWRIPAFIDGCDAVAFLERGFEIAIHGPQVPREVLWRRRALICSDEIVEKQWFADAMLPWAHYVPAGDPRDHAAFGAAIERMVNEGRHREIGSLGGGLVRQAMGRTSGDDALVRTLMAAELLPSRL